MRIYVVNVGVNASDASGRGMKSPVFEDGSFELVPIKETGRFASGARRYVDLPSWTGHARSLAEYLPERLREYAAHDDPDFARMTYGDIASGRAAGLKTVLPGDRLLFLARLWDHRDGRFTGPSEFHFIGSLLVTHNLAVGPEGTGPVQEEVQARFELNAHAARARAGSTEPYRVLVGDPARSSRFEHAMKVTPELAGLLFGGEYSPKDDAFLRADKPLLNKNGVVRRFKRFGSITRSIQWFLDDTREEDRPWCDRVAARVREAGGVQAPGLQGGASVAYRLRRGAR